MLANALKAKADSLAGKIFEKQLWSESGKLIAVKADSRWNVLV
jgi:hypothetical protein